ncbi:unnamed protein product [Prorocentrum cordatum]|uniref:Uncharacterized protein n=1 Tax=Prorocentrum cordatum TaxID=2364126 RepID=A0ABN9XPN4_9DINO|nr:unnamed protein product [Polarella glacialis]
MLADIEKRCHDILCIVFVVPKGCDEKETFDEQKWRTARDRLRKTSACRRSMRHGGNKEDVAIASGAIGEDIHAVARTRNRHCRSKVPGALQYLQEPLVCAKDGKNMRVPSILSADSSARFARHTLLMYLLRFRVFV